MLNPQQEKLRLRQILTSPEAASRRDLAEHLAYSTDMPAAQAIALMRASPLGWSAASLTVASPPTMSAEAIASAWSRAVERVNSRVRSKIAALGR